SKIKLQPSTKTLIVKIPVPITNCILRLANAKTWDVIKDSSDDSNGPSIPKFPSTDKEDTIVHTGQDPIYECHSLKSKAKYVPVSQKHNLNVKSPIAITGCMLGLPNVDIWDDILKKFEMRTHGRCADNRMNERIVLTLDSSDDSKGVSIKGPSITSITKERTSIASLSKEPILKELLAWYRYDIVEDYLPVAKKPILKVILKSHNPIKGCVLGLANAEI
ncbi:hypothetical protein Tco_0503781, partial [Tanacetum coccineum]